MLSTAHKMNSIPTIKTQIVLSLKRINVPFYRRKRKAKGGKGKTKSNGRVQHKGKGDQIHSKNPSKATQPINHSSQSEEAPKLSKYCNGCVAANDTETDAQSKANDGGML